MAASLLRAIASAVCLRRNRKGSAPDLDISGSSSNSIAVTYLRQAPRVPEADSSSFSVSSRESNSPHFSDSSSSRYPPCAALASLRPDLRGKSRSPRSPRHFGNSSPQNPYSFLFSGSNNFVFHFVSLPKSSLPCIFLNFCTFPPNCFRTMLQYAPSVGTGFNL